MNHVDTLSHLIAEARRAGADAADALLVRNASLSVSRRLGKIEQLERSEGFDIGLRVFVGRRQAVISSTDADARKFTALAERAVAMARVVPEDPFAGLAGARSFTPQALDLDDGAEPSAEALLERAAAIEEAALAVTGITNSEGGEASWSHAAIALVTSEGFAGEYARSAHSTGISVVAGSGTAMERGWEHSFTVHLADLEDAATLGHRAAERAVARLNPRRPATARLPVVFDPRVSGSLLGHLAGAINGAAVARGTSFLKDSMGQRVLAAGLTVRDDPRRPRGLRSRPFDGEGLPGAPMAIVEDGVLTSWILDSRSARQLGLASTGHASRGTGGPPGPATTNFWLEPGHVTPGELIGDIAEGLYVTDMIGMGVNGLTGDYSRGAAGFMIRDGAIAEPVAEITIAGHLTEMFAHLIPAN
ncbi:MAG TPA: TldD/PmbA family protein, partial [Roseomonas sp.]